MSGFDDDIFSGENTPENSPAKAPRSVTRSRADDLLDAVEGVAAPKQSNVCPACGSDKFKVRGPTLGGGTRSKKCMNCRLEVPWASVPAMTAPPSTGRNSPGPYYSGKGAKPKPDKNLPPHRVAMERHKK